MTLRRLLSSGRRAHTCLTSLATCGGFPRAPPARALRAASPCLPRAFTLSACTWRDTDDLGGGAGLHEEDEDDDDVIDDSEVEELFRAHAPAGQQQHRVFVVHPDVKWGSRKQHLTTAELMMAEAVGLVNALDGWRVVEQLIMSTKTPEKKKIFGKGNFQTLTDKIRQTAGVTAVFVNVERLSPPSEREFEEAWGVKVLDRYSVVLHIFRCNARTREAKLQVSLAEIPLLRSRIRSEMADLDQQGGGARYIGGSGETQTEVRQRLLREREMKIRSALETLSRKRRLLSRKRRRKELPTASVLGYTNCGKTTLIKALTGDGALQPRDQLFATLDVTVHAGRLPSHMTILYVDTIGFLSQLPHRLIDSFSATLEDIKHSDLLIHVRDISHPETENQKANVLKVLGAMRVPERLLLSMIEVHNKTDLVPDLPPPGGALAVSALRCRGLEALTAAVEERILASTGKRSLDLSVDLRSAGLSWLYREAAVQRVEVDADAGSAVVTVIIGAAAYGRYRKLFPGS
ncbi:putative GTP-binding protein 6 [Pseudoliparis swirei]|uniref:putative GTP-binding protein 6 n=1 Tax=Pseudoliparis swirei TaxID=2059687 RepID=UPI0024BDD615|nr:putative GTP-binding protein 6 [Pseudoliparis swirei]